MNTHPKFKDHFILAQGTDQWVSTEGRTAVTLIQAGYLVKLRKTPAGTFIDVCGRKEDIKETHQAKEVQP